MRSLPDAILVSTWLHVGTKTPSKSHRGGVLGRLGCVLGRFGRVFGRLGAGLGPSWGILDASWKRLGRLGGVLGAFWGVLGAATSNECAAAPAPAGSQAPRPANIKRQLNKETSM